MDNFDLSGIYFFQIFFIDREKTQIDDDRDSVFQHSVESLEQIILVYAAYRHDVIVLFKKFGQIIENFQIIVIRHIRHEHDDKITVLVAAEISCDLIPRIAKFIHHFQNAQTRLLRHKFIALQYARDGPHRHARPFCYQLPSYRFFHGPITFSCFCPWGHFIPKNSICQYFF